MGCHEGLQGVLCQCTSQEHIEVVRTPLKLTRVTEHVSSWPFEDLTIGPRQVCGCSPRCQGAAKLVCKCTDEVLPRISDLLLAAPLLAAPKSCIRVLRGQQEKLWDVRALWPLSGLRKPGSEDPQLSTLKSRGSSYSSFGSRMAPNQCRICPALCNAWHHTVPMPLTCIF